MRLAARPAVYAAGKLRTSSGEECEEAFYHRVRGFLGEVMTALDGATRHFGSTVLPPDRQRVVPLTDLAFAAPQHQERTRNLGAGGAARAIVLQVDGRSRPIVFAHATDHFGSACRRQVVCQRFGM